MFLFLLEDESIPYTTESKYMDFFTQELIELKSLRKDFKNNFNKVNKNINVNKKPLNNRLSSKEIFYRIGCVASFYDQECLYTLNNQLQSKVINPDSNPLAVLFFADACFGNIVYPLSFYLFSGVGCLIKPESKNYYDKPVSFLEYINNIKNVDCIGFEPFFRAGFCIDLSLYKKSGITCMVYYTNTEYLSISGNFGFFFDKYKNVSNKQVFDYREKYFFGRTTPTLPFKDRILELTKNKDNILQQINYISSLKKDILEKQKLLNSNIELSNKASCSIILAQDKGGNHLIEKLQDLLDTPFFKQSNDFYQSLLFIKQTMKPVTCLQLQEYLDKNNDDVLLPLSTSVNQIIEPCKKLYNALLEIEKQINSKLINPYGLSVISTRIMPVSYHDNSKILQLITLSMSKIQCFLNQDRSNTYKFVESTRNLLNVIEEIYNTINFGKYLLELKQLTDALQKRFDIVYDKTELDNIFADKNNLIKNNKHNLKLDTIQVSEAIASFQGVNLGRSWDQFKDQLNLLGTLIDKRGDSSILEDKNFQEILQACQELKQLSSSAIDLLKIARLIDANRMIDNNVVKYYPLGINNIQFNLKYEKQLNKILNNIDNELSILKLTKKNDYFYMRYSSSHQYFFSRNDFSYAIEIG